MPVEFLKALQDVFGLPHEIQYQNLLFQFHFL